MSRKRRKGFYVDGGFVAAADGARGPARDELEAADTPSRTARKNASRELQDVGEQLLELRADVFRALPLPETLRDAVIEAKRITTFGAKRRQFQLIGKLMRRLDAEAVDAVRAALRAQREPSAKGAALLHAAEQWRDSLIRDDERLEAWVAEFPESDVEVLRSLLRQARREAQAGEPGEAARKGKAYRQIFTIVHGALRASANRGA